MVPVGPYVDSTSSFHHSYQLGSQACHCCLPEEGGTAEAMPPLPSASNPSISTDSFRHRFISVLADQACGLYRIKNGHLTGHELSFCHRRICISSLPLALLPLWIFSPIVRPCSFNQPSRMHQPHVSQWIVSSTDALHGSTLTPP